jgi:hypothetical protein
MALASIDEAGPQGLGGDSVRGRSELVVKGLMDRDTAGVLTLTERGRAVLRAMLPDPCDDPMPLNSCSAVH